MILLITDFFPSTLMDWAVIGQAVGSLAILLLVLKQIQQTNNIIKQTNDDSEKRLRPWIGLKSISRSDDIDGGDLHMTYEMFNYGQTPATSLCTCFKLFDSLPTESERHCEYGNCETLVPGESSKLYVDIKRSFIDNVNAKKSDLYILTSIKYNHFLADKEGLLEFIEKYEDGKFNIIETITK